MIAPCGIDCGKCRLHLREKNPCPGCRVDDPNKPKTRLMCKIKNCDNLTGKNFCVECGEFPCRLIKNLDKRYRKYFDISPIDNLWKIKNGSRINHEENN